MADRSADRDDASDPVGGDSTTKRLTNLDGLRSFAVGLVLVEHGLGITGSADLFRWWAPGPAGVRLFFVLSGFLITRILFASRRQAESKQVARSHVWHAFLIRRALRIFPLAYAAIYVAYLFGLPAATEHKWWYITYLSNFHDALYIQDSGLAHFWSLAVEEQFYLVWPILILWLPLRFIPSMIALAIVGAGIVRADLIWHDQNLAAYLLPFSRADALGFGALMATAWGATMMRRITLVSSVGAGLVLAGLVSSPALSGAITEWGMILVSAAMIMFSLRDTAMTRWLSSRPLVYLGRISYGIYVWHFLALGIVAIVETRFDVWLRFEPGAMRLISMTVGSVAMASLSWYTFEKWFNDQGRKFPYLPDTKAAVVWVAEPEPLATP